MTVVRVKLWGMTLGAVAPAAGNSFFSSFEYAAEFDEQAIEPSPFLMPFKPGVVYTFMDLPTRSFHGLPGMLANSLPDKFGNRVIDRWLQSQGKSELTALERHCYTGTRGMGALEFEPDESPPTSKQEIDIDALRLLANEVVSDRRELSADLQDTDAMQQIVQVGTSAGALGPKLFSRRVEAPSGPWTRRHQMSINGKLDGFELSDFIALGDAGNIKKRSVLRIFERVKNAVDHWKTFAEQAGVAEEHASQIGAVHRQVT